jgi:hypothetical protein
LTERSHNRGSRSGEADRYRRAATNALQLVDWCIEYFADNGQQGLAQRLARNRRHIAERLKS